MKPINPSRPACWTASLRPDAELLCATADEAAAEFIAAIREPFAHRPDRRLSMPKWSWFKWLERGLDLAAGRIATMLLIGARHGGVAWTVRVLSPLAALGDCDVIPRRAAEHVGTITEETAEASLAHGEVIIAANRSAPRHELVPLVERAKDELGDLLEATR